jgi:spore maturation protein CgeB
VAALRRLPGARVIAVDVVPTPTTEQVGQLTQVLAGHGCSVLFTVNEWGVDTGGALRDFLERREIVHLNWFVDDPFYEETMLTKKYRPSRLRFDFVSDKGYVASMREQGYNAFFLPLAVDPAYFHPAADTPRQWEHDAVFVGNSYLRQMDDMLKMSPGFVDTLVPFLGSVVRHYHDDMAYDVEGRIAKKLSSVRLPNGLSFEKALFIAKHAAGYLCRKQMVVALAKNYAGFTVFGEKGWLQALPPERLGTAKYYDSLCDVYRKSKIIIDINRMVIRNGFTQRVFDGLASGGFVITSAKPVVKEFFETEGPRQEIAVFRSQRQLLELVDYFLAHEEERLAIAERGMKKVLAFHTYDHRIREMFRIIKN